MTPLKPGFYNMDCMDGMRQFPDGYFDPVIVDPEQAQMTIIDLMEE